MSSPTGACCGPDSKARVNDGQRDEQGSWVELDGMKTYITGPQDASRAILFMYDILGFIPQSTHGADLLASSPDGPFLVIMPDWFEGHPASLDWLPPREKWQQEKIDHFFETAASVEKSLARVQRTMPDLQTTYPSADKWAIIGFCWGGKIAALASQEGTPFAVSAQSSPAFLDYRDASKIVIPTALLASNGEPVEEVDKFREALTVDHYVEYFTDYEHGWMTSRALLDEPASKTAYEDGYRRLSGFLTNYM